jgi:hypothetical protein
MVELDANHRRHAVCELAIRDLKAGAGLAHLPSGQFNANAAWLLAATLAHNLIRWIASLGLGVGDQQTVARTLRRTCWCCPAGSPAPPGAGRCTCLPAGRGPIRSPWRSHGSAASLTPAADHLPDPSLHPAAAGQRQPAQPPVAARHGIHLDPTPAVADARDGCFITSRAPTALPVTTDQLHPPTRNPERWIQAEAG